MAGVHSVVFILNDAVGAGVQLFMEKRGMFTVAFATILSVCCVAATQANEAQLAKGAKITKSKAETIALAKVPHGTIKSAEIEREKGHLVWSFDISTPKTRDITEVLVDARTGEIISKQIESPADQAREAAADQNQHR